MGIKEERLLGQKYLLEIHSMNWFIGIIKPHSLETADTLKQSQLVYGEGQRFPYDSPAMLQHYCGLHRLVCVIRHLTCSVPQGFIAQLPPT